MRVCAREGCENTIRPLSAASFCSDPCRAAQWKLDRDYRAHRPSRENGAERRTNASGLQVSFRKAVESVAREFKWAGYEFPDRVAENVVARALSDRQRKQWEARR